MKPVRPSWPPNVSRRPAALIDLPDDLRGGDGDDRQVVGSQPQRGDTEQQRQHDGQHEADEDAEPEAAGPRRSTRDDHRVAGDHHEAGLAEVQQARVAEVHVEADGGEARR